MTTPSTLSLVLQRARAFPAPVVSVAINVLVVCTLVSGLAASLGLLQQDALAGSMATEPHDETVVAASAPYDDEDPVRQDRAVRDALRPVVDVAGGDVVAMVETGTHDLGGTEGRDGEGWIFTSVEGDGGRLEADRGRLPAAGTSGPLEVAAPDGAGLEPGDRLTLTDRADGDRVEAVVTGTWTVGADTERWLADLDPNALVTPADRIGEVAASGTQARWRAVPSVPDLQPGDLGSLAAATTRATTDLEAAAAELGTSVTVDTGLVEVLGERARELTVLRALLLVPAGLLILVAAAGLVLVAAGLADVRREEEGLLRSRGANQRQLVGPTALETLLVCGLAALVAPPVATAVISFGDVRPPLGLAAWAGSAVAASVCAVALLIPVVARALTGDRGQQESVERQRRRTLTALVATGVFVAGLGMLAVATLRGFGDTVGSAKTATGVDPLLVASPALLLLALVVVAALVVLPPLFGLVSRALAARGVASSLGSRFAARAPGVSVPLALTVALGSGVLAFAAIERDSSAAARQMRADHVAGADVRVVSPPGAQRAGVAEERLVLESIDGVDRAVPVHRADAFVDDLPVQVLMTDVSAETAPDLLGPDADAWRDVVARPWASDAFGVALPEDTHRLRIELARNRNGLGQVWVTGPGGEVIVLPAEVTDHAMQVEVPPSIRARARLLAIRTNLQTYGFSISREQSGPPGTRILADGAPLQVQDRWWAPGRTVYVTFGAKRLTEPATVPVTLTEDLAADASLAVGDTITLPLLGIPTDVEVAATVPYLRTVVGGSGGVLVDADTALPTLLVNGFGEDPGEWWLDVAPGRTGQVAAALADHPDVAESVVTRDDVLDQLADDPSTGGTALGKVLVLTGTGCLVVGALLLFSVVLLRRPEHAEQGRRLGAAGGDRRDLIGVLGWEYAVTTGAGMVAGVLAGALVAAVTLVSMTLGPNGELLVPEPELLVPWLPVLLAPLAMVTMPLLAMVWLTRRGHGPGLGALDGRSRR